MVATVGDLRFRRRADPRFPRSTAVAIDCPVGRTYNSAAMEQFPTLHVSSHPAVLHKLALLRDQDDRPQAVPRAGARDLVAARVRGARRRARRPRRVQTPLEETQGFRLGDRIGLVPILRAGLGMVDAMLELMPTAEVWHLGLFRDERTLRPVEYYNKLPDSATVDLCLILDPMLATGGSATAAIEVLKAWGAVKPVRIKLLNLIASPEGVRTVSEAHPDVDISLRGAGPAAQREGLHHARARRRRRPPIRDGEERLNLLVAGPEKADNRLTCTSGAVTRHRRALREVSSWLARSGCSRFWGRSSCWV